MSSLFETGIGTNWGMNRPGGNHFPDPFCDYASTVMPSNIRDALRFCEFVFHTNSMVREAARRVLSYFITDVEVRPKDITKKLGQDEKDKYDSFLGATLDIKRVLHEVGLDFLCFHGDTRAVTRDGVFKLRDLAGKTADVLSKDGVYRPAQFKSFGRQELLEVEFTDGRKVLATPEHQWIVKNHSGKVVDLPTADLLPGHRIPRTVAPRPEKNDEFHEGVRHGFVFGDGSLYNGGAQAAANFYGPKDAAMLRYFEGCGSAPREYPDQGLVKIHGLPARYKQLPPNGSSASYWYGFVCGFLAADGTVDTYGCAVLTQKARATLDAVVEQLPRVGMAAGPVRVQRRTVDLSKVNGSPSAVYDSTIHFVTLLKRFMQADDFLIPAHRENFEKNYKPTRYGEYVAVRGVRSTGVVDEVFCCVEMASHSFVIENAVLTRNCYGNSFTSLIVPFRRHLVCPKCYLDVPLREMLANKEAWNFKWQMPKFHATCQNPRCSYSGPFHRVDRRTAQEKDLVVHRWPVYEMEIRYDPIRSSREYVWRIPEDYRAQVRRGDPQILEGAPWEVIEAVEKNGFLLFEKGAVYHMYEPTLCGVRHRGWGISRTLVNFRHAWYTQVLHRYNEAIALDYIVPMRVVTPAPQQSANPEAGDPLLSMDLGGLRGEFNQMIARHRQDPATWHFLGSPINYQILGGEANQLAPSELLDQGISMLLNGFGMPAELYKGTLSLQAMLPAIRLFQSSWTYLVHSLNGFIAWLMGSTADAMGWEPATGRLMPPTQVDDVQNIMAKLQLMQAQQISQTTALRGLDLDFKEETRNILEEEKFKQEEQGKIQEEMETAALMDQMAQGQVAGGPMQPVPGQAPGEGGMPAGRGGAPADPNAQGAATTAAQGMQMAMPPLPNQQTTMEEMQAIAEQWANYLLTMPEAQRQSEMTKLKGKHPALHSLVKTTIENIRQQAQTAGGQAVMQQQFGGT